jgi:glycosyltransferase involved in cell wall biosynthesis
MPGTLITIGITCYREGDWLRECWESVVAQTDDRWVAVLVMDGGADQKTREVFAGIEDSKLIRKFAFDENVGPYPVRNKAFELSETPYHFYLDGDDMLPPGCIAAMYRTLEKHPDAAFVYGDSQHYPSGERFRTPVAISSPADVIPVGAGLGLYRVDSWGHLGGFSEAFTFGGSDGDFKISMYEAGMPMYNCGELFYVQRTGNENSVYSRRMRSLADVGLLIAGRHPTFFAERAVRDRFLNVYFRISISSNLLSGNRRESLRYTIMGFRQLGFLKVDLWLSLLGVIIGRSVFLSLKPVAGKVRRLLGLTWW